MIEQSPGQPFQPQELSAEIQAPPAETKALAPPVDAEAFTAAVEDPSRMTQFFRDRKQALANGWRSMKESFTSGGSTIGTHDDFDQRLKPTMKPLERIAAFAYEFVTIPKQIGLFALEAATESPVVSNKVADIRSGRHNPVVRRAAAREGDYESRQMQKFSDRAKQQQRTKKNNNRFERVAPRHGYELIGYSDNGSAKFRKVA